MAAEQEVEELLEAALAKEKDCYETEEHIMSKRKERCEREDEMLSGIADNSGRLATRMDELVARFTLVQDELKIVKLEHEACAEKEQALLRKAGESTEEVRGNLTRLHAMLTMKYDLAEMLTPPAVFTVDNFEERKNNDETWFSQPFYSHTMGYKMCLRIHPNGHGDGHGTHISAFVIILPGEFDDLLAWPFCGRVTIQLQNRRKSGRGHISMEMNMTDQNSLGSRERVDPIQAQQVGLDNLNCWGFSQFAALSVVCAPQGRFAPTEYLKEDKLDFRVWKVDTFSLHH